MKRIIIVLSALISCILLYTLYTNNQIARQMQSPITSLECPISNPSWTDKYQKTDTSLAFSTAERELDGLYLQILNTKGEVVDRVKEPSWKIGGTLGSFTFDKDKNIYLVPTPIITIGNNPKEQRQSIFKVDNQTGVMAKWFDLPVTTDIRAVDDKSYLNNVYGNIGITSDCKNNKIYVSSILGSDKTNMKGKVFEVDLTNKVTTTIITGIDCYGLSKVVDKENNQFLLFGNTRELSIGLYDFEKNKINSTELKVTTPNVLKQDYRVKKIRLKGEIFEIGLYPFDYTLATSGENLNAKTHYQYKDSKWTFVLPQSVQK
jgi:hypothetical protein